MASISLLRYLLSHLAALPLITKDPGFTITVGRGPFKL
jgi:hypothetical protein